MTALSQKTVINKTERNNAEAEWQPQKTECLYDAKGTKQSKAYNTWKNTPAAS